MTIKGLKVVNSWFVEQYSVTIMVYWNKLTNSQTTPAFLSCPLRKKPFENILGKGENGGFQHFVRFPECFLLYQRHNPDFKRPQERSLLKTLWEKEKMLVTSIFPLFPSFSTPPKTMFNFWVTLTLLSAKSFIFNRSKILLFDEELKSLFPGQGW